MAYVGCEGELEVEDEYTLFRISRKDLYTIADVVRLWLLGDPDDPDDSPYLEIAGWFVEAVDNHFQKLERLARLNAGRSRDHCDELSTAPLSLILQSINYGLNRERASEKLKDVSTMAELDQRRRSCDISDAADMQATGNET
jgi:hypothetical protein